MSMALHKVVVAGAKQVARRNARRLAVSFKYKSRASAVGTGDNCGVR